MLDLFFSWQEFLKRHDLNLTTLAIIAGLCMITLFFSTREFVCWYYKVGRVLSELENLQKQVEALNAKLDSYETSKSRGEIETKTIIEEKLNLFETRLEQNEEKSARFALSGSFSGSGEKEVSSFKFTH